MPSNSEHVSGNPGNDRDADADRNPSIEDQAEKPDARKADDNPAERFDPANRPAEYGGPKGPDPVRYGDWEKNGRCIDF